MYIVLDTNILTADKQFSHSLWSLVGSRPNTWNLRVAVPWPVAQEAIANRWRDLVKMLRVLTTTVTAAAQFGIQVAATEPAEALREGIDEAEEWFLQKLVSLRIEVLPADFDHVETVTRAVNRRRPCDSSGNGYRDTLSWITVLRLVKESPEEQVIWVSNDSDFFEEKKPGRLHQHLIEDLTQLGATAGARGVLPRHSGNPKAAHRDTPARCRHGGMVRT